MIDLSQSAIAYLALSAILLGAAHGVLYDMIRFVKLMLGVEYGKPSSEGNGKVKNVFLHIFTFICDVIFWICFAVTSVILTYNMSGGVFRGIVYLGMLGGGALYYFTLGRLVLKINIKLTRLVKKTLKWLYWIVTAPIRAIISLIIKLYHLTIGKVIGKIVSEVKRRQERRKQRSQTAVAALEPEYTKEEKNTDVTKYRYKGEGRISFYGRGR